MSDPVETLVENFVRDIRAQIRSQVLAEVNAALQAVIVGPSGPARRGAAAGRKTITGGRRARRSPQQVAAAMKRVLDYVKSHPGQRAEQLASALGTSTADLVRPLKGLIA